MRQAEFKYGFVFITVDELQNLFAGFRDGLLRKDALRVYAAEKELMEHRKFLPDSMRTTAHLINGHPEGKNKLRPAKIEDAASELYAFLQSPQREPEGFRVMVSRRALQLIAEGRLSLTEALLLLFYFTRRKGQNKPIKCLEVSKRYARFTYALAQQVLGVRKETCSRAVKELRSKGLLETVSVPQQNINRYGMLFTDGLELQATQSSRSKKVMPMRVGNTEVEGQFTMAEVKNGQHPSQIRSTPRVKTVNPNKLEHQTKNTKNKQQYSHPAGGVVLCFSGDKEIKAEENPAFTNPSTFFEHLEKSVKCGLIDDKRALHQNLPLYCALAVKAEELAQSTGEDSRMLFSKLRKEADWSLTEAHLEHGSEMVRSIKAASFLPIMSLTLDSTQEQRMAA